MTNLDQEPQSPGLNIKDIYYVLFRRKWMIAAISLATLVLVALVYFSRTPVYQSEAKVLVRYILDRKSVNPEESDAQVRQPDARGDDILNSELEILNSFDLAREVAGEVGPERILSAPIEQGNPTNAAAFVISRNLHLEVPKNSNIIRIIFQHPDPAVVQSVLSHLVEEYKRKHLEIHRAVGFIDDLFNKKRDELRGKITITDDELSKLKRGANIISVEESRKAYAAEIAKIKDEVLTARADLEERKAILHGGPQPASIDQKTNVVTVSQEILNEYLDQKRLVSALEKKEGEILLKFKDDSPQLKQYQSELIEKRKRVRILEQSHPELVSFGANDSGTNSPLSSMAGQTSLIGALEAKISFWTNQLQRIQADASNLDLVASKIAELEREKKVQEDNYQFYNRSLEQAHMDEATGPGKVSNIPQVQAPSPPTLASSKLMKILAVLAMAGVGGSIGLAFLFEMFLRPGVKRPVELRDKFNLPLFLTIPKFMPKAFSNGAAKNGRGLPAPSKAPDQTPISYGDVSWKNGTGEVAPWDSRHPLHSYFEMLSNRIVADFEFKNMTHKPKLVALTSCSKGAGVSTLATGLAASLSETGGGNVLLVDMNQKEGAAHPLYQGKPGCGLPDVLEHDKRNAALVQENFYMVSANHRDDGLPRMLPKRFSHLMPKMKASDYDYIIFDMPPIDATGMTARLAGLMDSVILVVESEKTNRDSVKLAKTLLDESKANTSTILNKYHKYIPEILDPEM
jgi:uncharacterized protein involved in exopolysaccharide biosynthesis/Mrp family chromosome partitioning ATPase